MVRLVYLLLLLFAAHLSLVAPAAVAQAVEAPVAFDTAGRVMVITPPVAARLQLGPPAWRVTGDFREARLYRAGGETHVLVVTRPTGMIERYAVAPQELAVLRARVSTLPPGFSIRPTRVASNAFVVTQSALGLGVYAPSFARAVTNEDAGRAATYLLIAGGTFFAASALAREMQITPTMNRLAAHAAVHGALGGLGTAIVADAPHDGRALGVLVGSLLGTGSGLYFGQRLSDAQADGAAFGADALALAVGGLLLGADRDPPGVSERTIAGTLTIAGLAGYPLGVHYVRRAPYNVTSGDIYAMWPAAAVGVLAAGAVVGEARDEADWYALTGGMLAGLVAGDLALVRRFDHTPSQAGLVTTGALAGGLMGAGASVLIDRGDARLASGLAAIGAVAGMFASEYFLVTPADATTGARSATARPEGNVRSGPGRRPAVAEGVRSARPAGSAAAGMRLSPIGAALALGGVRGTHAVLTVPLQPLPR